MDEIHYAYLTAGVIVAYFLANVVTRRFDPFAPTWLFLVGYVQIYVKSSALSRTPDLAISAHLLTEAEIDDFVNDAITELEEIRLDAKKALTAATSH